MDVSPQAITNYKKRGSIPLEIIVSYAAKNKRSVDNLIGIGIEMTGGLGKEDMEEKETVFTPLEEEEEERETPECRVGGEAIPVVYMPYYKHQKGKMYEIALIEYDAEWFRRTVESREGLVSFIMDSDNMFPTINIGDPIIISTQHNKIAGAGIYAFVSDGRMIVRRVAPGIDGGLLVTSDNAAYATGNLHTFSPTAKVLGRVVWKTTRV